jgi:hypothetical protein
MLKIPENPESKTSKSNPKTLVGTKPGLKIATGE